MGLVDACGLVMLVAGGLALLGALLAVAKAWYDTRGPYL